MKETYIQKILKIMRILLGVILFALGGALIVAGITSIFMPLISPSNFSGGALVVISLFVCFGVGGGFCSLGHAAIYPES